MSRPITAGRAAAMPTTLMLAIVLTTVLAPTAAAKSTPSADPAKAAVARYVEARGGLDAWRAVETMAVRGTYTTFSERAPFTLVRARGDRYRLDLQMLGNPTIRARDAEGPWWQFPLTGVTEPARLETGPYVGFLERESCFEPLLFDATVAVTWKGEGDVDGQPAVVLEAKWGEDRVETWYLDPETHREIAVDASVHDFTQGMQPMRQRTFYADFRDVGGLQIPHRVEIEFGARLEVIVIDKIELGRDADAVDEARFAFPGGS